MWVYESKVHIKITEPLKVSVIVWSSYLVLERWTFQHFLQRSHHAFDFESTFPQWVCLKTGVLKIYILVYHHVSGLKQPFWGTPFSDPCCFLSNSTRVETLSNHKVGFSQWWKNNWSILIQVCISHWMPSSHPRSPWQRMLSFSAILPSKSTVQPCQGLEKNIIDDITINFDQLPSTDIITIQVFIAGDVLYFENSSFIII